MSLIHVTHYRPSSSRAAEARKAARQAIRTCWLWVQRIEQRAALRELDDDLLRDIGKSRAEAEAESNKPFWLP